ncbi:MAG: thioredoxin family protein [Myxococcaceae bacterium]|jgi:hypothetical protein|nr:MAG: thioredoxin family protein [Myxococcaceae bacterium]
MADVELLYFPDCPNVPAAREQLARAFAAIGLPSHWTEVDMSAENGPEHARGYGSPTILIDRCEVTGVAPFGGSSCRVYAGSDLRGAPPLDVIVARLRIASDSGSVEGT